MTPSPTRQRTTRTSTPRRPWRPKTVESASLSGGNHTEIEGYASDKPDNLTLFVFPSYAKLMDWYESDAVPAVEGSAKERLRRQIRLGDGRVRSVTAGGGVESSSGAPSSRWRRLGGAAALAGVVLHVFDGAPLHGELREHLRERAVSRLVGGVVVVLRVAACVFRRIRSPDLNGQLDRAFRGIRSRDRSEATSVGAGCSFGLPLAESLPSS